MGLFTIGKKLAKAADGLLDDALDAGKKVDAPFDEEAWLLENPRPHPGVRLKDMTPEQVIDYNNHKGAKSRAKNIEKRRAEDRAVAARRRGARTPEEQEEYLRSQKDYRKRNKDDLARKDRERKGTPESLARRRERYAENPEPYLERNRRRYRDNPAPYIEAVTRRKRGLLPRTPEWRSQEKIDEIYRTAQQISEETGVPHEVDHVIPLSGSHNGAPSVSGLHHQDNLLIIPKSQNRSKGPKFEPGDLPPRAGVRKSRAYLKKIREAKEAAKQ